MVELAIVITIIALLAGAILIGSELVTQGETRLITRELARYESAYTTFRDKYDALPGDMSNAAAIWGIADGNVGNDLTCQDKPSFDIKTCSGNGDGVIMTSKTTQDETHRAWQHLKNAGLVEGKFGGSTNGVAAPDLLTMVDAASQAKGIGYQFFYDSKNAEGWANTMEDTGNLQVIRVAAPTPGVPPFLGSNALSPFITYSIDDKIDDGNPASGKVFAFYSAACATSNDAGRNTDGTSKTAYITRGANSEAIGCFFNYDLTK